MFISVVELFLISGFFLFPGAQLYRIQGRPNLPALGRGGPGEDAAPVALLHPVHRRHYLRRRFVRRGTPGRGQAGAAQNCQAHGTLCRAHPCAGQQTGPAHRCGAGQAGERAGLGLRAGPRRGLGHSAVLCGDGGGAGGGLG